MAMPTQAITRVDQINDWETFWEIWGEDDDRHFHKFTTNKRWMARVISEAKRDGKGLRIDWRPSTRFGQDIVSVRVESAG